MKYLYYIVGFLIIFNANNILSSSSLCAFFVLDNKNLQSLYRKEFKKYGINLIFIGKNIPLSKILRLNKVKNLNCPFVIFQPITLRADNSDVTITTQFLNLNENKMYEYSINVPEDDYKFPNLTELNIITKRKKYFISITSKYIVRQLLRQKLK